MSWVSFAAITFIVWWIVLFATLPWSLRTQDDEDEVTLGTVSSAPQGPHMLRAALRTTVVTAAIMLVYYVLSMRYGIGIDSIPRVVPDFG